MNWGSKGRLAASVRIASVVHLTQQSSVPQVWALWASVDDQYVGLRLSSSDLKWCSPGPLHFLRYLLVFMNEQPSSQFSTKNQMPVLTAHILRILTAHGSNCSASNVEGAQTRHEEPLSRTGFLWRKQLAEDKPQTIWNGLEQETTFSNSHKFFTSCSVYLFGCECDLFATITWSYCADSGVLWSLDLSQLYQGKVTFCLCIFFSPLLSFPYSRMKCHCL